MRSLLALLVVSGLAIAGCGPATTTSARKVDPAPVKVDTPTKPIDPAPITTPATKPVTKTETPKEDKKEDKK